MTTILGPPMQPSQPPETQPTFVVGDVSEALKRNLNLQSALRLQLRRIDAARANVRTSLHRARTMESRLPTQPAFPQRTSVFLGSSTLKKMLVGSPEFVDNRGARPPVQEDARRFREQRQVLPLVYRLKNWTDKEREGLARGVRQQNMQLRANRLLQEFERQKDEGHPLRLEHLHAEIAKLDEIPEAELEASTDGVDWGQVQAAFVPTRTAHECRTQWLQRDDPRINHGVWSREEDKMLLSYVSLLNQHNWEEIARRLGTNRTPAQAFERYQRCLNPRLLHQKWQPQEDARLCRAVDMFGRDWLVVADHIEGRTGQMCLHRYTKGLNPHLRKGRWSLEEDLRLHLAVHATEGSPQRWVDAARFVPTRSDGQVRERWENVLREDVRRAEWTQLEDSRMWFGVAVIGAGRWSDVARVVGERTDNQVWRRFKTAGRATSLQSFRLDALKVRSGTAGSFAGRHGKRPDLGPADFRVVDDDVPARLQRRGKRRRTDEVPDVVDVVPASQPESEVGGADDVANAARALLDACRGREHAGRGDAGTPADVSEMAMALSRPLAAAVLQSHAREELRAVHDRLYFNEPQPAHQAPRTPAEAAVRAFAAAVLRPGVRAVMQAAGLVKPPPITRTAVRRRTRMRRVAARSPSPEPVRLRFVRVPLDEEEEEEDGDDDVYVLDAPRSTGKRAVRAPMRFDM